MAVFSSDNKLTQDNVFFFYGIVPILVTSHNIKCCFFNTIISKFSFHKKLIYKQNDYFIS